MNARQHFDSILLEIRSEVVRMGNRANEMVRHAVEATTNDDAALASQVVKADDEVDGLERALVEKTLVTVLRESPVAHDLRFLVSTLGVLSEIEKTADHAVKLARRVPKLAGRFPAELKLPLQQLGDMSRKVFSQSLRLFTEFDDGLAMEIVHADEAVDKAYSNARSTVIGLIHRDPGNAEHYIRTMEAFHTLEHVADCAVAIAQRVRMIYSPPRDEGGLAAS